MNRISTFLGTTWRDLRAFSLKLMKDREALVILILILFPWLLLLWHSKNLSELQPLLWIFGLLAFYWLVGRQREIVLFESRKPRLEFLIAMIFIVVWAVFRIVQFWHLYPIPTFGISEQSCASLGQTAFTKTIEMFILPVIVLLVMKYSFRQMGFTWDKFSWLVAILPLLAWIAFGLTNHPWKPFLISSGCYFFAAGLTEEFLFRAFLQTRLEAILRRPVLAAFLAAFIFGCTHIPIDLGGSFSNWQDALLTAFTYQMSIGFMLGYAYVRARDVLPLAIFHTLIDSAV